MSPVAPARAAAFRTIRRVFESGAYADRALQSELPALDLAGSRPGHPPGVRHGAAPRDARPRHRRRQHAASGPARSTGARRAAARDLRPAVPRPGARPRHGQRQRDARRPGGGELRQRRSAPGGAGGADDRRAAGRRHTGRGGDPALGARVAGRALVGRAGCPGRACPARGAECAGRGGDPGQHAARRSRGGAGRAAGGQPSGGRPAGGPRPPGAVRCARLGAVRRAARSCPSPAPRCSWHGCSALASRRAGARPVRGAGRQDDAPGGAGRRHRRGRGGRAPPGASGGARADLRTARRRLGAGAWWATRPTRRCSALPPRSRACSSTRPCSGLGTLRSRPDLRWRTSPERIAELDRAPGADPRRRSIPHRARAGRSSTRCAPSRAPRAPSR